MAVRTGYAGVPVATDALTASNFNKLPGGKIGRASITTDSAGTTSTETVVSVAPTVGSSREIDIHVHGTLRATGAGAVSVRVTEDGTQIGRKNFYIAGSAEDCTYDLWFTSQPSSGSHTYALITGVSGTPGTTVTDIASVASSTQGETRIEVYDSGPAF